MEEQNNDFQVALVQQETHNNKTSKKSFICIIVLLVIALAGSAFGVWAILDGNAQKNELYAQINELKKLNEESMVGWTSDDAIVDADLDDAIVDADLDDDANTGDDNIFSTSDTDDEDDADTSVDTNTNNSINTNTATDLKDYIYLGKIGVKIEVPQKKYITMSVETDRVMSGDNEWADVSTFHIYETRPGGGIVGQKYSSCENVTTGFNNWVCFAVGDINLLIAEIGGMYEGTLSTYFWDYFTNSGHYSKI